jgi:hypothetical protein
VGDEQNLPSLLFLDVVYRLFEARTVVEEKARSVEVFIVGYYLVPLHFGVSAKDVALLLCGGKLAFCIGPDIRCRSRHDKPMIARGSSDMIWPEGVGTWRSQVAHSAGGRVVAGSNPAVPTFCRVLTKSRRR